MLCKNVSHPRHDCSPCTRLYVPRSAIGCSGAFKDSDRMAIVYREIKTSTPLQNALDFQKPDFNQVVQVRKNRARVNKIKCAFGKGQMVASL
jgi:hypothetical protein